jgi:hypothetical protein
VDERHITLYERVISMLHVRGDGPFVLRVGGDSSDHAFFDPHIHKLPSWAFDLTLPFVARTARVVRELRLRVILDLNLITATPRSAEAWAREAEATMPKGSIIGFEVGNEPDLYSLAFWTQTTEADRFGGRVLPKDITPADYVQDFDTYSRLLSRAAPRVSLYAPALANPNADLSWIATLLLVRTRDCAPSAGTATRTRRVRFRARPSIRRLTGSSVRTPLWRWHSRSSPRRCSRGEQACLLC